MLKDIDNKKIFEYINGTMVCSIKEIFRTFYNINDKIYVQDISNVIYINIIVNIIDSHTFVIHKDEYNYTKEEIENICKKHMKIYKRNYNINKLLDKC